MLPEAMLRRLVLELTGTDSRFVRLMAAHTWKWTGLIRELF